MVVAMADHADAKAHFERVVQDPFERAPRRMHLDRALDTPVMRIFDVGIAPTDMRDDAAVFGAHGFEQLIGGVYRIGGGLILDEDVRGAADRPSLVAEENIAVAAHAGVARPFVARQANKLARSIEQSSKLVQLFPKRIGDLKIIALVTDHVDEGLIARIAEIVLGCSHSDGLAALAMQIGPIAP